jgi:Mor family transcriptional regulator
LTENRNGVFCWDKSRQILNRLFEGYCKDYGPEDGAKIIKAIIDILGGCRLTVPEKLPSNPDNAEALLVLYAYLCELFGQSSGEAIMRKFLMELKNCRISFPDYEDLYREERNRKIKSMFNGSNYKELATRFNLAESWIWRIVNKE